MIQDIAIYTMERQQQLVCNLSNGAISNDLKWPLTQISSSRYYLMLSISETVRDRDSYKGILAGTYICPTQGFISNDFEWLSEIFNDTKNRAASLRQLSFFCQYSFTGSLQQIWQFLAHEATIYNEVRVYRFHVNQNTLTPKGTPRLRFMSILLLSCTFSVLYKHAIADEVLFLVTCVCVCVCVSLFARKRFIYHHKTFRLDEQRLAVMPTDFLK